MRLHTCCIRRWGERVGQEYRQAGGSGAPPGYLPRHPVMSDGIRPHQQFEAMHSLRESFDFPGNGAVSKACFGLLCGLAGGGDQECAGAAGRVEQMDVFVEQSLRSKGTAKRSVHFGDD